MPKEKLIATEGCGMYLLVSVAAEQMNGKE